MEKEVLLCLVLLGLTVGSVAGQCPVLRAAEGANKTGCYIVVLKNATTVEKFNEILRRGVDLADEHKVYGVTQKVCKAFTVKLSSYCLNLVSNI